MVSPRRFNSLFLFLLFVILYSSFAFSQIPEFSSHSNKFIRSWLLCGPFPNELADGGVYEKFDNKMLGYYKDFLKPIGGENNINPSEGLEFTSDTGEKYAWQLYDSPDDYINFTSVYDDNQAKVCYAACILTSDSDREALMGLGSNDGVKAWLNGELVWGHHCGRGAEIDQDWVRLSLKKGQNRLLLKIVQGLGSWGLYARFIDLKQKQAELITESRPVIEAEFESIDNTFKINMGRTSNYLILDKLPDYKASLVNSAGKVIFQEKSTLGKAVSFPITAQMESGPYWIKCETTLPDGQPFAANDIFYFHGNSPFKIKVYDRSGNLVTLPVQMLDSNYNMLEEAIREDSPGTLSILRPDVSHFYLQVLLDAPFLGRRLYIADNAGKGYTLPKDGKIEINLPLEAARSLRSRVEENLPQTPQWLKQNVTQRLQKASLNGQNQSAQKVYDILDILSTTKSTISNSGDIAVWYAPGIEKVARDESVPEFNLKTARVSLARNEYEPLQIVLNPKKELTNLTIDFTPLKSQDGTVLPKSEISINLVDYIEIKTTTDQFGSLSYWPDALPEITGPFTAKARENTPVWITVHAPKDQQAGLYSGKMLIKSGNKLVTQIPFEIAINNFTLPDETCTEMAYGSGIHKKYHGNLTESQYQQVHDMYMKMFASHRISPYHPYAGSNIDISYTGDPLHPVIDYTKFDKAMTRYMDEFHFNSFRLSGFPGKIQEFERFSEEYNRLFTETYRDIQEHLRQKGWLDNAYWYWVDEPPIVKYPEVARGMELLKTACPDIHRLLTCNNESAPIPYFYDKVNLWVPIMQHYDMDKSHARQKTGEKIWWYVCTSPNDPYPNNFIDHPAINHRIRFWMIDRFDMDGSLYWSTTAWYHNPWEQAMSINPASGQLWGNGDGILLYPPLKKESEKPVIAPPVTTIRFELLRDGVEDREYLMLYKNTVTNNKNKQNIIDKTRNLLVKTKTSYEQNPILFISSRDYISAAIEEASKQ